jgi:uncharacterized protein (DUF433 family)
LLSLFGAGWAEEEIMADYLRLKREDFGAVFAYATELYRCSDRSVTESSTKCPGGVDT